MTCTELKKYLFYFLFVFLLSLASIPVVKAAEVSPETRQAVVWVHCGGQQGSGVVINTKKGYVLTNAHVLIDEATRIPQDCEVGFIKIGENKPSIFYYADWVRYIFDPSTNRDFAILKIDDPRSDVTLSTFPEIKTHEFFKLGENISIISYPGTSKGSQAISTGSINAVENGMIKTDAEFQSGSSGGAGVTTNNGLVGLATGILYEEVSPGVEHVIDYELVDIRAVITWLDTFGDNYHDLYITHVDYNAFHDAQNYIETASINCSLLAKTEDSSAVYCLRSNGTRSVFPTSADFLSWFADYSAVIQLTPGDLTDYHLISNVTMKPGSLVKIESNPMVYVVSDNAGTLRWIPNEDVAKKLFGQGWAGMVKDIPVTFFQNYRVGEALPEVSN
ncbi:MAG: serine protease [Patescibacteria group bacterium]